MAGGNRDVQGIFYYFFRDNSPVDKHTSQLNRNVVHRQQWDSGKLCQAPRGHCRVALRCLPQHEFGDVEVESLAVSFWCAATTRSRLGRAAK